MGDINKNVNLTFTTKDKASAGLKNIANEVSNVDKQTTQLEKSNAKLNSSYDSVGKAVDRTLAKYLSIAFAYSKLTKLISESTELLTVQEQAEASLSTTLGYTSISLLNYAGELQKVTTFGDEVTISSMSQIAAFVKDEKQIKDLTRAAQALAIAKKMDLKSATDLLVKSISSGTNALKEHGIKMQETADVSKRISSITEDVAKKYGGLAEAIARTPTGRLTQLKNEMGDLKEGFARDISQTQTQWEEFKLSLAKIALPLLSTTLKGDAIMLDLIKGKTISQIQLENELADIRKMPQDKAASILFDKLKELNDETEAYTKSISISDDASEELTKKETKRLKELGTKIQMVKDELRIITNGLQANASKNLAPTGGGDDQKEIDRANKLNKQLHDLAVSWASADAQARWEIRDKADKALQQMELDQLSKTQEGKLRANEILMVREMEQYQGLLADEAGGLEKYLKITEAISKKYEGQRLDIVREYENKKKEERLTLTKESEDMLNQSLSNSLQGRLKIIDKNYSEQYQRLIAFYENSIISHDEYLTRIDELTRDHDEKIFETKIEAYTSWSDKLTGIASTLASNISNIMSITDNKQLDAIDENTEKNKKAAEKNIKNKKQLQKELDKIDKEAENKKKEIAKNDQKMAMIMSIINTAQAVSGALTMKPPPLGIAMAIIVGALGAAQTVLIGQQAFAQGGIVQPQAGVPTSGDKTTISANPGEMVLNQRQQRNLLNMANNGGVAGGITISETIIVQGNMDSNAVEDLKRHRDEWLEMLRDSNKQLKYRGYTYAQ